MARFAYFDPEDVSEVLELLRRYGEGARIIAGGQSLLILIRQGFVRPEVLISLHRISSLRQIQSDGAALVLGTMVTQSQIGADRNLGERFAVLAQSASRVGSVHVQNLGTVGGNVCHAEPNGDSPPALLALGASVQAVSPRGARNIPLEDFFRGPFENVLEPDEFVTEIRIPDWEEGSSSIYLKHVLRGVDRAIVGVGVRIQMDAAGVCRSVGIGLCGAGPVPFRAREAESLLVGQKITDELIEAAGSEVSKNCEPLSDGHGPGEYKKKMAALLVKRALHKLLSSQKQEL